MNHSFPTRRSSALSLRIEGKVSGIEATTDVETFNYSAGIVFTKPGAIVPEATFEARLEAKSESPDAYDAESIVAYAGFSYDLNRSEEHTSELQSLIRYSYAVL